MRSGILFLLLCNSLLSNGQSSTSNTLLIVLGRYSHEEESTGYSVDVTLEEDPNKCDPVRGFVPLEDQVKHFKESLMTIGIRESSLTERKSYLTSVTRKKTFEIRNADWTTVPGLFEVFRRYNLEPGSFLYTFKPKKFEDEDDWAIAAFENARDKAETIASFLGRKIKRIVNVDDDTRRASVFDKRKLPPLSSSLENLLADLDDFEDKSYSDTRSSSYTLRVTFELE